MNTMAARNQPASGSDVASFYAELVQLAPDGPRWSEPTSDTAGLGSQQQSQGSNNQYPVMMQAHAHIRPMAFRSSGVHDMSMPAGNNIQQPSQTQGTSRHIESSLTEGPGPPQSKQEYSIQLPNRPKSLAQAEALLETQWQAAQAAHAAKEKTAFSKAPNIASDNVGFKLLKAAGWTEGKGLGRHEQGVTAPIDPNRNPGSQGIGFDKRSQHLTASVSSRHGQKATVSVKKTADGKTQTSNGNADPQRKHIGPVPKRVKVSALVDEELEGESLEQKLAYHKAVIHAEAEAAHARALQIALRQAFDDPFDNAGSTTANMNPLGRNTRISAMNPLLDND